MKKLIAYLIAAVVGLLIIVGASEVSQGKTPKAKRNCAESRLAYDESCRWDAESRACLSEAVAAQTGADCEGFRAFIIRAHAREEAARLRQHRRTKRL